MSDSLAKRLKRNLVSLLLRMILEYGLIMTINRDSADNAVVSAYRKVMRRAHPDKGGSAAHAKTLNDAYDEWCKARKTSKTGRPSKGKSTLAKAKQRKRKEYRIQSKAVMLTYPGSWQRRLLL